MSALAASISATKESSYCRRRAVECARLARAAVWPGTKAKFHRLELSWREVEAATTEALANATR
jgi:hypothetical protein